MIGTSHKRVLRRSPASGTMMYVGSDFQFTFSASFPPRLSRDGLDVHDSNSVLNAGGILVL